jgi:hypothetical protein
MTKITLPRTVPTGLLLGVQLASISARAGGRPINRIEQFRAAVIWSCLALGSMPQKEMQSELRIIWVYPAAVAAGWLTAFGVITAAEFAEEAPMGIYLFRRDLPKNFQKLRRRFFRA